MIFRERFTRSFKRGVRFLGVGAIALALMPQIVATVQPAMAVSQTCTNFGGGTFTVLSSTGQDSNTTLANDGTSTITLIASFNRAPARNTTFTVTGPGVVTGSSAFSNTIRRTGTGTITVVATFLDPSNNRYSVTYNIL